MSSPVDSQVHPGSVKPVDPETRSEVTNSRAWQEGSSRSSKTLEHLLGSPNKAVYTDGFSSEDDSEDEESIARGMTRSLGRKEMNRVTSSRAGSNFTSNLVSVSKRSAAYKELVSSQNIWNVPKASPKHSAVKLSDGSDTSPVQSRIELNPFFQLDKQGKIQTGLSEERRKTSNSTLAQPKPAVVINPHSSPVRSPAATGMSVQMRIKMWADKENDSGKSSEADTKLINRRSLQPASLLSVHSNTGETQDDCKVELVTHSDDESAKKAVTPKPVCDNMYEEIVDQVGKEKIAEASSSSDASPVGSPSKTFKNKDKKTKREKGSPKLSKKTDKGKNPDSNTKQSKWKLRSPLNKRKSKSDPSQTLEENEKLENSKIEKESHRASRLSYSRKAVMKKKKSGGRKKEEEADDVFKSEDRGNEGSNLQQQSIEANEKEDIECEAGQQLPSQSDKLPSVFDKMEKTDANKSFSHEVMNMIDAMGSAEPPSVEPPSGEPPSAEPPSNRSQESNSDSDSESDGSGGNTQSSLDMQRIPRLMKRRASDSYKKKLGVQQNHVKGRKGSFSPIENSESVIATALMYADVVWDREASDGDELSFRVGDVIEILDMTDDVWWHGSVETSTGWFPSAFVRLRVGQDSESEEEGPADSSTKSSSHITPSSDCLAPEQLQRHSDPTPDPVPSMESESANKTSATMPRTFPRQQGNTVRRRMTIRRRDSSSSSLPKKLTPEEVRVKIVEEILGTERDYVKHLEDIIEGFLKRCRDYGTLFDDEEIDVIFSNIEEVYSFQTDFLKELEARIKPGHLEQSEIGEVFVLNQHEFKVYSQYCNNHPHAVTEMSILQENEQYSFFFESCRLLRNLQDISLEGFLLTPVQRICKYPLQLSELLKYTGEDHPDHSHVVAAQEAMKGVAMLINEQKRRIENIGKIGCWQRAIDGWKGPDILESSTEMIHYGELHKISKGHSQERHFFLFDHQLVYCKKDAIGAKLCYKGRVDLDNCRIADITDSHVLHGSTPVRNCWRMNNKAKDNKWYIIYAKSPQLKEEWMKAFQRERERIEEDEHRGFSVSMKMKKAAVALCANDFANKRRGKSMKKQVAFNESIDGSSGSKKLTMSMNVTSPLQPTKKNKTAKRGKLNSVSSSTSAKVIF